MRAPLVTALSLASLIAGATAAHAADLSPRLAERWSAYELEPQQPAGQILLYDYEPGVVVRAWWAPPWRNRHYFPSGAVHQARFRHERRQPPQRAERYERSWSTCSVCAGDRARSRFFDFYPGADGRAPALPPRARP